MAKPANSKNPKGNSSKPARGRTNINSSTSGKRTRPHVQSEMRTEADRPIGPGAGDRGDRRDTSRLYTNNEKHSARGNTPRADVKTRAR